MFVDVLCHVVQTRQPGFRCVSVASGFGRLSRRDLVERNWRRGRFDGSVTIRARDVT